MKKKSLIIVVVIIIIAVLGLMIAIMSKPTNTNKEDNKANNTESSQTESESLTENTETEIQEDVTTGTGDLSQFIPEGAKVEPDADGKSWVVTLENGIQYFISSSGRVSQNVAQWKKEQEIDPDGKWVEHIDLDGFGPGISYDEYKEKQANGTLTWENMANLSDGQMSKEEAERRTEDGFIYGDKKQREDGSYYIELDDGTILESGDELPDGGRWVDNSQW